MQKKKKRQGNALKRKKFELNFSLRLKSATTERQIWETHLKAYRNSCLNDDVRKMEQKSTEKWNKCPQAGKNKETKCG